MTRAEYASLPNDKDDAIDRWGSAASGQDPLVASFSQAAASDSSPRSDEQPVSKNTEAIDRVISFMRRLGSFAG